MKYYVYVHRDIGDTYQIVYIGKGTGGRAWDVSRSRGNNKDHQEWMQGLMEEGKIPSDWVQVVMSNLSEKEAFEKEKALLHTYGQPKFNRTCGERNHRAKLTDDQARDIYVSKDNSGVLSRKYGVSRAAIQNIKKGLQWRAATSTIRN